LYVCLCNAVTDREIRVAVGLGARTLGDLQASLGIGLCCGRCAACASEVLAAACAKLGIPARDERGIPAGESPGLSVGHPSNPPP
jgi:bacterioferritin-associated ferredoxin